MKPRGDLQLAIGYWFVSHKQQFRTWWAIVLLSFLGLSTVWVVVFFSIWFSQQPKLEAQIASAAQDVKQFSLPAEISPVPLRTGTVTVIPRDAQHSDLVADIENPNADWGATEVQYRFAVDGKSLPTATAFVNPASKRPLIQLNQAQTSTSVSLEIIATTWRRISAVELPAPNFEIGKIELTPNTVQIGQQSFLTVRLTSNITNRSVYSFLKVTVPIVVKRNDTIVAVDEQTLDRWQTLTARPVTATWPFAIAEATAATVAPQVSQFDRNNLY